MSIKITKDKQVKVSFREAEDVHSEALTLDEWTLISVTFAYYRSPTGVFARSVCFVSIGTLVERIAVNENSMAASLKFDQPPYKVRIGGPNSFIGAIAKIDFFSPGSIPRTRKI